MADSTMFLKEFKEQIMLSINIAYPAKVLSFDRDKLLAKIQPLFMTKEYNEDAEKADVLEDIPVLYYPMRVNNSTVQDYKPDLKSGMVVQCLVNQRSMDDADVKQPYNPGKARVMNLQDSVIVGVLPY